MRRDKMLKESKPKRRIKVKPRFIAICLIIIIAIICIAVFNVTNKDNLENEENSASSELTLYDTNLEEYVKETSSGIKINTSEALNTNKKVDGLDITNIQLTSQNGVSTLLADVTNNTSESTSLKNVTVTFLDEDGNELIAVKGVILALEVGASTKLNISFSSNYVSAYDFAVETK